jgi:hypothetical protein
MVDDDARDERIAAALEVEPLDEVTRRRLVSTALDATELARSNVPTTAIPSGKKSHAARWIAAAASIVIVLVAALALLTAPGGNDEQQASTPARTPEVEQKSAGAAADSAAPQANGSTAAEAAPGDAGDFGDLDVPANLDRLRSALEGDSGFASSAGPANDAASTLGTLACRDALPAGTVTAIASGTLAGRRAVVVRTTLSDGSTSIDAVLTSPCEVRPLS